MNPSDFMTPEWRTHTPVTQSVPHTSSPQPSSHFHAMNNQPSPSIGGSPSPSPSSFPSPTASSSFLENRVVSVILIGVILILIAIVAYLYFSTPKEAVADVNIPMSSGNIGGGGAGNPHSQPPRKKRSTPPTIPDEPEVIDKDGRVKQWAATKARRKEEIAAAKVAADAEHVSEDAVVEDSEASAPVAPASKE